MDRLAENRQTDKHSDGRAVRFADKKTLRPNKQTEGHPERQLIYVQTKVKTEEIQHIVKPKDRLKGQRDRNANKQINRQNGTQKDN